MRRALALLAAFLAGAAGLGLEILLLECAGLALGQGRAAAWGLALFVAGWALGSFTAGRVRGLPAFWIASAGILMPFLAAIAVGLVLFAARFASQWQADLLCACAIAAAAFVQGFFLPLLLRGRDPSGPWIDGAAAIVAANLVGSLVGALLFRTVDERTDSAFYNVGYLAAAAGIAGALAIAKSGRPPLARGPIAWRAGIAIALVTLWALALEYVGLRLSMLWIGGMQFALAAALAASVAGLALGAALLPPIVPRGERGILILLLLALVASAWPSCAHLALAHVDPVGDPLGLMRAGVLLVPALFPLGAFPAVLHRTLVGDGGERLGALYVHEAWGALLGLPLLHAFVLPHWGLEGVLAVAAPIGIIVACAYARASKAIAAACIVLSLGAGAFVLAHGPPALASPPLTQTALTLRSFREDRDFAVSVVDDGMLGERTLLTDGFRAAGTGRDYLYMQVLGHLPLLLHPNPERVAVLALGTGTTLGAVAEHSEVRGIDVLEISQAVVDAAPFFEEKNHRALLDPRSSVLLGDGRRVLAGRPTSYDVITMEPLLPDSPFGVYLYTQEFYEIARRALRPGGMVCQWVPPHALEPQTFEAVVEAFQRSFPWNSVWVFGTQVILLGGEREPTLDRSRWAAPLPGLAALGLDSPEGLAARWVCGPRPAGELWPDNRLTDDGPWILYLPRRTGPVLLGDLPTNLRWLREHATPLPEAWRAHGERLAGVRALHLARERLAVEEARLRGFALELPAPEPGVLPADDPEVQVFAAEREFLASIRRGVAELANDAQAALPDLVRAAELRRERADVHLYLAVALEKLGNPSAAKALQAALDRCPAIARTKEGARARQLGLSDSAWATLERAAQDLR